VLYTIWCIVFFAYIDPSSFTRTGYALVLEEQQRDEITHVQAPYPTLESSNISAPPPPRVFHPSIYPTLPLEYLVRRRAARLRPKVTVWAGTNQSGTNC
jgi:hypothetical protein